MKRLIARVYLRMFGWRTLGAVPEHDKFVLVAAPHTSNWDLPFLVALSWEFGVRVSWIGKHTLFRPPFGWFMRWLGGIPLDRGGARNTVSQVADEFDRRERLVVAISPEGTRGRTEHWRSGFYYIAAEAKVPIVLGVLDYSRKRGGFGPTIVPSGDARSDMDRVRDYYADKTGRRPENFGPVRLRELDDGEVATSGR